MVPEQIERDIFVAAPVERVWAALTESEHVGTWFGDAGAEVDLRPGGALVIRWKEYGSYHARVERVEPRRLFSYRGARSADEEPRAGNSTLVEFTLSPEGDGTRLRVVESGFSGLDGTAEEQAEYAEGNTEGWTLELDELRAYLGRPAG